MRRMLLISISWLVCVLCLTASVPFPQRILSGLKAWAAPQDVGLRQEVRREGQRQEVRRRKDDREREFFRQRLTGDQPIPPDAYDTGLEQWNRLPRVVPPTDRSGGRTHLPQFATTSLLGTVWKPIGPSPIIQGSSQVNGRVSSIAINPNNPNVVYQGSSGGGVWRTNNALDPAGANWSPLFDQQPSLGTGEPSAIAIDPNDTNTIYVGTSGRFVLNISKGILKSTNGGGSWIVLGSNFPASNTGNADDLFAGQSINAIIVDPANSNTLYLGASNGLFRSTDGGRNWTQGTNGGGDARSLVLDPTSPAANRILYAGVSFSGIRQSTDGGQTWTQRLNTATPAVAGALPAGGGIGQVLVDLAPPTSPTNPNGIQVLYASMEGTGTGTADPLGLFRSIDQGATWNRQASTGIPTSTQGGYSFSMSVDPASPGNGTNDIIYLGAVGASRSNDSGNNFAPVGPGIHVDSHSTWVFVRQPAPAQSIVFTGNDGGIWKSTDGGATWSGTGGGSPGTLNAGGLQTALFYNLDVRKDSTASVSEGSLQDNGTVRTTGPLSWTDTIGGDGFDFVFETANPSVAYHTSGFWSAPSCTRVFRSTDSGAGWGSTAVGSALSDGKIPAAELDCATAAGLVHTVSVDPNNAGFLYVGGNQSLFQTTNAGGSFRNLNNFGGRIGEAQVASGNSNNVVAAFGGQVFVTTNALAATVGPPAGVTFTDISRNLPGRQVMRVAFDPNDATVIYAVLGGFGSAAQPRNVFRTSIGGTTWTDISPPVNVPVNALALDGTSAPTTIYIGNDLGVMRSVDSGVNWTVLDDVHMPNVPVTDLAINTQAGVLRAATFGRGVFELAAPSGPVIAVNAENSLQFDSACGGGSADLTLQVYNLGTQNLRIDSVDRILGSSDFTVLPNPATPWTIPPNGSVTFTVRFTPTTNTPQKATIRVSSNDPNAPFYELTATGTSGSAVIATAIADNGNFGDICVGQFVDLPLTIDNRGNCDLRITALTSSSPDFQTAGVVIFPLVVGPGDSIQIPLRFRPTTFGLKAATIKITSNDPTDSFIHTVAVSGNAPSATIVVPSVIEFDKVCPGSTQNKTLTIGNSGGCDLIVSSITSDSLEFKVVGIVPFPLVVPPGSTRDVTIQFMPMSFGNKMATLTIMSNDLVTPSKTVIVKGIAPPPVIQVVPPSLDFGIVCLGKSKDLPITIKNTGECNLTVSSVTFDSTEFKLVNPPPFPLVIPPGGSATLIVRFSPVGATGPRSAKMTINSDDPATPVKIVNLTGEAPVSAIVVTGDFDFGTVSLGKVRDQFFNVTNTQPCDLLITMVCEYVEVGSPSGSSASAEFRLISPITFPRLIPGNSTLPVTIRFKPLHTGPRRAKLVVSGFDPQTGNLLLKAEYELTGVGK